MSVIESDCACGEPYLIEHDAPMTFRSDGKRIYQAGSAPGACFFRCPKCHEVVSESVPGAEWAPMRYRREL